MLRAKRVTVALLMVAAISVSGVLVGCGSGSSDSSSTEGAGNPEGVERHATVFEAEMPKGKPALPETELKLGNSTIKFAEGESLSIAFVGYGKGFGYTVPEYDAAKEVAEELGLNVTEFDPQGSAETQVSQIQTVLASNKYNALVVYPLAVDLECDLLSKQAPEKGLAVVAIGYPACADEGESGTPGLLTSIPDTPSPALDVAWAEKIVETQGEPDKQKALLVTGLKLDPNSEWAVEGVEKAFEESGDELQSVIETDFTEPDALTKIQDALQRYPETTMIIADFPEGTAAAMTALQIAGKEGDVNVYGYGADQASIKGLEEGKLALSVPYYPYTNVKAAYEALVLAREGKEVPPFVPYAGHKEESIREAGDELLFVTPENVKQFVSRLQEY